MPEPTPPTLTGWQYVILEIAKLLIPVIATVLAGGSLWYAGQADTRAKRAETDNESLRGEVKELRSQVRPLVFGKQ